MKKGLIKNDLKKIIKQLNLTSIELGFIRKFEHEIKIFEKMKVERIRFMIAILLARSLANYDLSYPVFLDYRLRIYYKFFLVGPGSENYLKKLIHGNQKLKLNFESFFHLLSAYYTGHKLFFSKLTKLYDNIFKNKLSSTQILSVLFKFFYCNQLNFKLEPLNKEYLHDEIKKLILSKNFSTSLLITIDQKSSSLVFFAILFRDQKLAQQVNLTRKNPVDVYEFLQKKFKAWLKSWLRSSKNKFKNLKIIIKVFESSRNLLKNAVMNFCYSQK